MFTSIAAPLQHLNPPLRQAGSRSPTAARSHRKGYPQSHPRPLRPGELPICQRGPRTGLPKQPERDRRRHLYPVDLLRIANAFDFAESQGLEWGVFITVLRTHRKGSKLGDLPAVQDRVMAALRRFCAKRGIKNLQFIWVRECQSRKLDHLHIITTIPDAHSEAVEAMLLRSLGFSKGGIKAKPAGNPFKLMRYFAKQLHPDLVFFDGPDAYRLRDFLGLKMRPVDLPLAGRRSGTSRGLVPARQRATGFQRKRSAYDLQEFYSGQRGNDKLARKRGWDDGPPDKDEPYQTH